jgi:hypothetical protein
MDPEQVTDATEVDASTTDQPIDEPTTLGDPGKKALDEERRARRAAERERGTLQAQIKELQQREAKRKDDDAVNAAKVADLEAQLVRERVGRRLGLSDVLIDRLHGATEEEISADAKALLAALPKASVTDLKQGAREAPLPEFNGNDWLRRAAGVTN